MKNLTEKENIKNIERYTNIGFCQPKFYARPAWTRAVKCMEILVKEGYAVPYDFGHGKGKYMTTPKAEEYGFGKLYEIVVASGLKMTAYKPRK